VPLLLALGTGACGDVAAPAAPITPIASRAALQDPETCKGCHLQHYREWASSMHAYSARDPVFIAMNERGQRETGGALGGFCVKCHAPMALELGLTTDGLNLPDLTDPNARGVTCYFCHDVKAVEGDHNRALVLAHDTTMRGGLGGGTHAAEARNAAAPIANAAHASKYSALHDGTNSESARLCGACHDIVNDLGVALERSFAEWRASRFSQEGADAKSCAGCHMDGYAGRAALQAPQRQLHRHMWPGVDVALEREFPGVDAQTAAIACTFGTRVRLTLAPVAGAPADESFEVTLINDGVGHAWPSGATQDRRAWVELVAYDADDAVIFQRGVFEAGEVVGANDPELEVLRDRLFDASGAPVHMFWLAAPSDAHPLGYESDLLPAPGSADAPGEKTLRYALPKTPRAARITARLRLQSIGLDVLDDFAGLQLPIAERVLNNVYQNAPTLRSRVPTITVPGTERELVRDGDGWAESPAVAPADCRDQRYVSLLPSD
jgi:hypothetical protein